MHQDEPTSSWHLCLEGRRWSYDEMHQKIEALPEKIEIYEGRLFFSEAERLALLGALLEHVGIAKAVRFGDPALWRQAIATLQEVP